MPKIKTIPNSCAKCTDARLPNKSYCRAHWNEYMRAHQDTRRRKTTRTTKPSKYD